MNLPDSVGPVPVVRSPDGYWCHPALTALYRDRDYISQSEYDAWLADNGLEDCQISLDIEDDTPATQAWILRAELTLWMPQEPPGHGWFIGAIFDNEDDGPVCIWLRRQEGLCDDR